MVVYGKNGTDVLYPRAKFGGDWFTHGDTRMKIREFLFFLSVCLSHWLWPVLVSQNCRNVQQFNEIQLRRLLIDFYNVLGVFRGRNAICKGLHHSELTCMVVPQFSPKSAKFLSFQNLA